MTVRTASGKIFQKRGFSVADPFAPAGELFLRENPERGVFVPVIRQNARDELRSGDSEVRNTAVLPHFAVEKSGGKARFRVVAKFERDGQGKRGFLVVRP